MTPTASQATAHSRDGRTFTIRSAGADVFSPGDVVVAVTDQGVPVLGQVLEVASSHGTDSGAAGSGVVLGTLRPDGGLRRSERPPFSSAASPASVEQLAGLQASTGADLTVGRWTTAGTQTDANLRTAGFNRHTFLCGQSGSGKTYALGVLLERLLLATDLRVTIVDPNADFVRLGETKDDTPAADAARIGARNVTVLRSDANRTGDAGSLRMRFRTMARQAQAAVLQLDPVRDADQYNAFVRFLAEMGDAHDLGSLVERMKEGSPADQRLLERIENLGMTQWEAWARDQPSAADIVTDGTGVSVLDLGGFEDPAEPLSICLEVVDRLWAEREGRVPTLLVIDEAHNLCRADPGNPVAQLLLERLIQLAAEGRKSGLWLLLSSQRPSKIHPQILSQCDNLMLMRMNSPDDIVELSRTFGFAPQAMLHASTGFVQGEALLAGGFAPVPMLGRMRQRLTHEGGSDVAVPLAQR
ncbi:MAG TPA: ATP-binding protein [Ornithinibacter sp.]|nr:ATP-binding protein [Ornithinibacter sp.]